MNSRKQRAAIAAKRYTGPAEPEGESSEIDIERLEAWAAAPPATQPWPIVMSTPAITPTEQEIK